MADLYTAEEVKQSEFLFISYSHQDKPLVAGMAQFLLEEGVRLWYDKDLAPGDEWPAVVKELICHPMCRGIIFVCSPSAYISKNIHEERTLALQEQQTRGKKEYPLFIVNVCAGDSTGSYMQLLKDTFDKMPADAIDELFPIKRLHTLVEIVGPDPLCIMTRDTQWHESLLDAIQRRALETIDKGAVDLKNMQRSAHFGNLVITLGTYEGVPLKWQLVRRDGKNGVFILQSPLFDGLGAGLEEWLDGDFRHAVFSAAQQQLLIEKVRLLSVEETDGLPPAVMRCGTRWWLKEHNGAKQVVVRDDGTVDSDGSVNTRLKRGVRPVVTVSIEDANTLLK